jgi:hypothetical protein
MSVNVCFICRPFLVIYVWSLSNVLSKFAQHTLETGHNYDTMNQIMKILHVEKKGPKLNTSVTV